MNVKGKIQKNGGNVASYFCTPDARVIHAVGKPVSANRLLTEARWAVDTYNGVVKRAPKKRVSQARLLQRAHLAALRTTIEEFGRHYRRELPRARQEFVEKVQSIAQRRSEGKYDRRSRNRVVPFQLEARRRAVRHFAGDRAHQILAAEPLASFPQVSRRLFEKLTGELYAERPERRLRLKSVARGLKTARERDMPVLFVFYHGQGEQKDEFDEATKQLLQSVLRQRPVAQPLKSFIVAVLPLRELAALSNLAKLPAYEFAARSQTTLVLARPDGSQVAAFNGSVAPRQLAARMWPLVAQSVRSKADKLSAQGNYSEALRSLRKITRAPIGQETRATVNRHIGRVRFAIAESWAKAGKTKNAIDQFRLVANNTTDGEMRERALGSIAKLQ